MNIIVTFYFRTTNMDHGTILIRFIMKCTFVVYHFWYITYIFICYHDISLCRDEVLARKLSEAQYTCVLFASSTGEKRKSGSHHLHVFFYRKMHGSGISPCINLFCILRRFVSSHSFLLAVSKTSFFLYFFLYVLHVNLGRFPGLRSPDAEKAEEVCPWSIRFLPLTQPLFFRDLMSTVSCDIFSKRHPHICIDPLICWLGFDIERRFEKKYKKKRKKRGERVLPTQPFWFKCCSMSVVWRSCWDCVAPIMRSKGKVMMKVPQGPSAPIASFALALRL